MMAGNKGDSLRQVRRLQRRGSNVSRNRLDESKASSQSEDSSAGESYGPLPRNAMSFIMKEEFPGLDKYEGERVNSAHFSYQLMCIKRAFSKHPKKQ
jgi:hypothetical protein